MGEEGRVSTLRVLLKPPLRVQSTSCGTPKPPGGHSGGASNHCARPCGCWLPSARLCLNPPCLSKLCSRALPWSFPVGSLGSGVSCARCPQPRGASVFLLVPWDFLSSYGMLHTGAVGDAWRAYRFGASGVAESRLPVCMQNRSRCSSLESQGRLPGGGRWPRGSGAHSAPKKG